MRFAKIFPVVAVSAILPNSAVAADLLVLAAEKPVGPEIVDTSQWNGFYVGAYGGYNWFSSDAIGFGEAEGDGGAIGGYIGHNWDLDSDYLIGLEATAGFTDNDGTSGGITTEQDWEASLRARMGYTFERSLIYGFAGLATTSLDVSNAVGSDSSTLSGYNFGAGLETEITGNWTARIEYGFSDYSNEVFNPGGTATGINFENQSVILGLGFKF